MDRIDDVRAALDEVRSVTETQLPSLDLQPRTLHAEALQRFGRVTDGSPDEATVVAWQERVAELGPWLQGPFLLGGDVVIEGLWRNDGRWELLERHVPALDGKRVLDVGSNAGYDPFMFDVRGARHVLACEPFAFVEQMRFLESVYRTGIEIAEVGWQRLDPEVHGVFDLVHCNGVLYHEPDPMGMLLRLREMVAPGGHLLLGTMMLESPEHADLARFVPTEYAGDPTWWWVPGRQVTRWLMEACGFRSEPLDDTLVGGPAGAFPVVNGYLRGEPIAPDPVLSRATSTDGHRS